MCEFELLALLTLKNNSTRPPTADTKKARWGRGKSMRTSRK